MKTRILHTNFWHDGFVSGLTHKEKLLFVYLLSNEKVGLTGMYEMPDKYIKFDLDITQEELDTAKEKFQKSGKFHFSDGWVTIINSNKYNNYVSNDKLKKAYNRELDDVPESLQHFSPKVESKPYAAEYQSGTKGYKHREIVERIIGRKLSDEEIIHHLDNDPSNNDPENLGIMLSKVHTDFHAGKINLEDTSMILVSDRKDTPNNHKSEIINHKSEIRNISIEEKQKIADQYKVPLAFVESKADDLLNWHEENPSKNKKEDWIATLRNWVKRDALKIISNHNEKNPRQGSLRL